MSNLSTLDYISLTCYAIAIIMFLLTIYLFFALKIRTIIFELSGKAKAISTKNMVTGYNVTGTLRNSGSTSALNSGETSATGSLSTSGGLSKKNTQKTATGSIRSGLTKTSSGSLTSMKMIKEVVIVHTNEIVQ